MNNIKEIIKDSPKEGYESFSYLYTRVDTQRKYRGKRKGQVGDGYTHSSRNKDLADDLRNPKLSFTYEVYYYGTDKQMLDIEQKLLTKVDAAGSSDWYNRHNGFGSGDTKKSDPVEIKELVDRILVGEWDDGKRKNIDLLNNLPRIQCRATDADQTTLRQRFIEKNGTIDELCDPVTLLEGRGENGEDMVLDGSTTIGAAKLSKVVVELPYETVPYEVHSKFSEQEMEWAGTILNNEDPKVVAPATEDDLVKQIMQECDIIEETKDPNLRELLKMTGKTPQAITSAIKEAQKNIRENDLSAKKRTTIKWDSGRYAEKKENLVASRNSINDGIFCVAVSSGMFNPKTIFQPFYDTCVDEKGKILRDKMFVYIYHNMDSLRGKDDAKTCWDSVATDKKRMAKWFAKRIGVVIDFEELPTDEAVYNI